MTDSDLFAHVDGVSRVFKGQIPELTQAIGALYIGRLYGYRVLRIVTSAPTHARHERILGLKFNEVLPEITDLSHRSLGYSIAVKLDKFWDIIRGYYTVPTKEKFLFTD